MTLCCQRGAHTFLSFSTVFLIYLVKLSHSQDGDIGLAAADGAGFVGGVTTVRWGKKSCGHGPGVFQLYNGITMSCKEGGTPVCLNVEEADDRNQMIRGSDLATIVPVQIRPREEEGLLDNGILECSVCQKEQQQQLMLPGMSRCPTNWDLDYKGWLMGGTNRPSTPICVVSEPAAVGRGRQRRSPVILYSFVRPDQCQARGNVCADLNHMNRIPCVVCTR